MFYDNYDSMQFKIGRLTILEHLDGTILVENDFNAYLPFDEAGNVSIDFSVYGERIVIYEKGALNLHYGHICSYD